MTRKDYERIAAELKSNRVVRDYPPTTTNIEHDRGYQRAVDAIAHAFSKDNSRFDLFKFLEASK